MDNNDDLCGMTPTDLDREMKRLTGYFLQPETIPEGETEQNIRSRFETAQHIRRSNLVRLPSVSKIKRRRGRYGSLDF